jgi:hypothetical protein
MTTRADRERHVTQMLANFRLEGLEPDAADKQLQLAYIDGTATLDDMLLHARLFSASLVLLDRLATNHNFDVG